MNQILAKSYQGLVNKASPTGLLPIWNKWVDKKAVAKYGFSYNPTKAKAILAAAGYKDKDGDGYVENKDGSKIDMHDPVPERLVRLDDRRSRSSPTSAKAVGIKITPGYPDYGTLVDDRGHANYDLVLANDRQYSNTPWTYYQYIFQLPILDNQTTVNYERFTSQKAWALTQPLDRTPTTNTKAYQAVMSQLQTVVHAESACDSALVQRDVGHVQHEVLDELAIREGRAVHAHGLAQLLADDEHRHAHASQADGT